MKPQGTQVISTLKPQHVEQLDRIAETKQVSRAAVIRWAVEQYLLGLAANNQSAEVPAVYNKVAAQSITAT